MFGNDKWHVARGIRRPKNKMESGKHFASIFYICCTRLDTRRAGELHNK